MDPRDRVRQADIRLLRVFQTIVQAGGISAAELVLNIGRSTISRHLSDLELRLGVKLCERGPAGFIVTDEGQRVLEAANRLIASIDNFTVEVNEIQDRLVGTLSIALFDMTLTNPMANVSAAFERFDLLAPDVGLQVRMLGTNDTEKSVLNGEVHVGIVPLHRKSASLDYFPLYSEDMYLFCGSSHEFFGRNEKKISPHDVRLVRYAGLAYQSPSMLISQKEKLNRQAEVDDQEALAILILSGHYIGFLPEHFAKPYVDAGRLKRIQPDRFHYSSDFHAIIKRQPKPSRIAQTFLDCLCEAHEQK
jgi:DNA-binding transcriptional LysR family regulator